MKSRTLALATLLTSVFLLVAPQVALAASGWRWETYVKPSGITSFGTTFIADDGLHIASLGDVYADRATSDRHVYVSSDGGATWITRTLSTMGGAPQRIVGSTDGKYLYADYWNSWHNNSIFYSSDYGETWTAAPLSYAHWSAMDVSADGRVVAVVQNDGYTSPGYVWVSNDYGRNWVSRTQIGSRAWSAVTISASGQIIVAGALDGSIYVSSDSGQSWAARTRTASMVKGLGLSGDGAKLLAVALNPDPVSPFNDVYHTFVSSDLGITWQAHTNPSISNTETYNPMRGPWVSADGSVAVGDVGVWGLRYTTDLGATWKSFTPDSCDWKYILDTSCITSTSTYYPPTKLIAMSKNGRFAAVGSFSNFFVGTYGSVAIVTPPTITLATSGGTSGSVNWMAFGAESCTSDSFTTGGMTQGQASYQLLAPTTLTITCSNAGGSASASTRVAVAFTIGSRVQTTAGTSVYSKPQTDQGSKLLCSEAQGATGTVAAGPQTDSVGNVWWQVSFDDGCTGWVQDGTLAISSTTPPPPPTSFGVGSRVVTTDNLNVRSKANINSGTLLCTQPVSTQGTIMLGPQKGQGYTWWYVNFDTGCDGWVVQDYLVLATVAIAPTSNTSQTAATLEALQALLAQLQQKLQRFLR